MADSQHVTIGTVVLPDSTKIDNFKITARTRSKKWQGKDKRLYKLEHPCECLLDFSIATLYTDTVKADLLAFYFANQGALFTVVDPCGITLNNCRFRKSDDVAAKPLRKLKEMWVFDVSLEWTEFSPNDSYVIADVLDEYRYKGGSEKNYIEQSESFGGNGTLRMWGFSDNITTRKYGFTMKPDSHLEIYNVLEYFAAFFYENVTVDPYHHAATFTGGMNTKQIQLTKKEETLFMSNDFELISFA